MFKFAIKTLSIASLFFVGMVLRATNEIHEILAHDPQETAEFVLPVDQAVLVQDGDSSNHEVSQENATTNSVEVAQELEALAMVLSDQGGDDAAEARRAASIQQLIELLTRGAAAQKNMRAALPEELAKKIDLFFKEHTDFIASIHAPHALFALGEKLAALLGSDAISAEDEAIAALRPALQEALDTMRLGLWTKMFAGMTAKFRQDAVVMLGNLFAAPILGHDTSFSANFMRKQKNSPVEASPTTYTEKDLLFFYELLIKAEAAIAQTYPEYTDFVHLKNYLKALVDQDINALANAAFIYVDPIHAAISEKLVDLQAELYTGFIESIRQPGADAEGSAVQPAKIASHAAGQAVDTLLQEENSALVYGDNPYYYWLTAIKQHEGSCVSYSFMKKRFKKQGIDKEYFQLFRLYGYAYNFVADCLAVHTEDVRHQAALRGQQSSMFDENRLVPSLLNLALTSTVAANYFFNVQSVARNAVYYDAITTEGGLNDMGLQMRAFVADYIGIAAAAPTLYGAPLYGREMRSYLGQYSQKCAASWTYYMIFYSGLFNRANFFGDMRGVDAWPVNFAPFRTSFMQVLNYSVDFLSLVAEVSCYQKINPELLDGVDSYTCGLVRPGAIRYVTRAFLPMLLASPAGNRFLGFTAQHIRQSYGLATEADAQAKGMSSFGLYAEQTMVDYAAGSLGRDFFSWVGYEYSDAILSGAGYLGGGIAKVFDAVGLGFGDHDQMVNVACFVGVQVMNQSFNFLRSFLWDPELVESVKPFMRGYLLERGYLSINHTDDEYRASIVKMMLTQLAYSGFLNHYDAAVYARFFKKEQSIEALQVIYSEIAKDAKKRVVSMGLGFVGEHGTRMAARAAHDHWGPITPKIRGLFN